MKQLFLAFAIVPYMFALLVTFAPQVAKAEPQASFFCADGTSHTAFTADQACTNNGGPSSGSSSSGGQFDCGGVKTSIDYKCSSTTGGPIFGFIRAILKFLSGLVGLVVLMMLIIGGIRYITSSGDPKMVAAAKNQIVNAVTALVLFGLMLAILNFLLPGGIIG